MESHNDDGSDCTNLQLLAKSIRKYMKSYLPKLVSSTIALRRDWPSQQWKADLVHPGDFIYQIHLVWNVAEHDLEKHG